MTLVRPRLVACVAAIALVLGAGCSGSDDGTATPAGASASPTAPADGASPEATASTSATSAATPAATTTGEPTTAAERGTDAGEAQVDNVLKHVRVLASEIGIRSAGTEEEREAADYIAGVLDAAGYETSIEPFPISTRINGSSITIEGEGVSIEPFMMTGSATAEAAGTLVYGGLGAPDDLADLDVEGRVLLLDRGILTFGEKARNAELAGAVALIVANNERGFYNGNLGGRPSTIPVVAITQAEGELLRPFVGTDVTVSVRAAIDQLEGESQNVVGRSGGVCRYYIGAHYDSVPQGPGANDNASGTGLMLELARVHRVDGLCVVAFGAEEIGLFGSEAYVAAHDVGSALFMLNFDMAGRLDDAVIIGDDGLTDLLLPAVEELPIRSGEFPPFASSDHVSFLNGGVAAVTITSGDDPLIHQPGDDVDNVSAESLTTMLEVGERSLAAALAAAG